jgi:RNA polymerase sigma-70 factor (ECF subfamily)
MDDEAAMHAVRAGDGESLRVLVRRYQGPLFRLVRSFLRDAGSVEDTVQDVFVRAFEALEGFGPLR